ncbi:serine/threonine-protein kinase LATS2 [Protopterus annectens]|uniref:serine/threonine-protein kinase LATS2 n=1 Tax=Protopterus annectens TaxID=7888 RepID=UPI001CFA1905|nr:serine/threonine-protein kinase LATS2 [Protopterus annectens]
MAVRALKQTGSRSIQAALEYISKMSYLDPRNEQIVRVIKQTSPGKSTGLNTGDWRPGFEGSDDSLTSYHHMNSSVYEGPGFGADGPNLLAEVSRPYMNVPNINFLLPPSQSTAMNAAVQRPPSVGPHPALSNHQHQQKTYPAKVDAAMINYQVSNHSAQTLQMQGAHASNNTHYLRHPMVQGESVGYGVQRSPSFQNKMQQEANFGNLQNKVPVAPNSPNHPFPQPPSNLYIPHSHHRQTSPSNHQMHVIGRVPAYDFDFSDVPQNILTPSRDSLNLDLYDINGAQVQQWQTSPSRQDTLQSPALELTPRQLVPYRSDAKVPSRTNSFNSHKQQVTVPVRQASPNKLDPSLSPTLTTVSAAHILQPVKSMRVMRPEPQKAVGPAHPGWLPAQAQAMENLEMIGEHSVSVGGAISYGIEQVEYNMQEPRCPPPPYPKHLLMPNSSEQFDSNCLCNGVEQSLRGVHNLACNTADDNSSKADKTSKTVKSEKPGKDKKQIQTSPVPVRKNTEDEEKRESRIKTYSPFAFKFYMEQHIENVMKMYHQKINRRLQLEQEMAKAGLSEVEKEQMRKILYQKESNYNRLKRAKMDKSMFVKIKTLGTGAFGEVCLARKVDTHALYAMKTLRKKDVLSRNQVAHVKAERDILAEADNEWVVKLYYSFQDKDNLYFVMDYIPGGDMMSLLMRMEVFPEHLAKFYIAELTLAIESVHKMGFIHRDIKPDNILIDLDGHIKLTDFGLCTGFRWTHNSKYYQKGSHIRQDSMEPSDLWDDASNCKCGDRLKTLEQRAAKQHQRCLAHSLVGTPNYIAPEVLLRKGYTQLCDWWSVGVILFEMLVGQPPFLAATPTETQIKVINWETSLHIPPQVKLSPEASDLITRLCCAADDRLGRNGTDEIKAHSFFTSIDFSSDIRRQPAPYVPKLSHPMDTSNFDPVEEEGIWNDSGDSTRTCDTMTSVNSKHSEHAFYEFTFRRFFDDNGYPFRYPKPSGNKESQTNEMESEDKELEHRDSADQAEGFQPVYV